SEDRIVQAWPPRVGSAPVVTSASVMRKSRPHLALTRKWKSGESAEQCSWPTPAGFTRVNFQHKAIALLPRSSIVRHCFAIMVRLYAFLRQSNRHCVPPSTRHHVYMIAGFWNHASDKSPW